jgi:hypothetical protein
MPGLQFAHLGAPFAVWARKWVKFCKYSVAFQPPARPTLTILNNRQPCFLDFLYRKNFYFSLAL